MCTLTSPAIGTRTVLTPGNIVLPKSKHNVAVACAKQCYSNGEGVLISSTEIMTAGNVVFGGLIGLAVDAASGAMNKYEPAVRHRHVADPQLRGAEKRPRRADGQHAAATAA
jgi:hypothetical protein